MAYGKSQAMKKLTKIRRVSLKKKIIFIFGTIIFVVLFIQPYLFGVCEYEYITKENMLESLHEELAKNFTSTAISDCEYYDNVNDETELSPSLVDGDLVENHRIKDGGEWAPNDCKPKYSTAIIVPFRSRDEHLRGLLVYLHMFLRHQRIHYRIYVVEQLDTKPFNRGKLLNIGAVAAIKAGYPCLILHDVDMLPLKLANLYVCSKQPRHMSANVDKFRFVPPSTSCFNGVTAILSNQFQLINGMSNLYFGWGNEDDDLSIRLGSNKLRVCSFEQSVSVYHMMEHDESVVIKGDRNPELLSDAKARQYIEGLKTLRYTEVATVLHPLFTHIMVDL